jgi:hypothetical protein
VHVSVLSLASGPNNKDSRAAHAAFNDFGSEQAQVILNRCVPVILTMMEKPGRYYLLITIDPALGSVQLIACTLELR